MPAESSVVGLIALVAAVPLLLALLARLRPTLGVPAVFLAAALFMPQKVNIDFPLIPSFDKRTIPALCVLTGYVLHRRARLRRVHLGRGTDLLWIVLLAGTFATSLTNGDEVNFGSYRLPAITSYDAISQVLRVAITVCVPYVAGRVAFQSARMLRDMFTVIVIGALAYCPLIVIEVILSPQLHRWIYGFHQHEFAQTMRGGGYRPMVFMSHGLVVAQFIMVSVTASCALYRVRPRGLSLPPRAAPAALGTAMILMKSAGAFVFACIAAPLALFAKPQTMVRVAVVVAAITGAYPVLRATEAVPTEDLVRAAESALGADRAQSLSFRFRNEGDLLERARKRIVFGWGPYGRNLIFDETGKMTSIVDGEWIIVLGANGALDFVCRFGLFLLPVLLCPWRLKNVDGEKAKMLTGTLALIVGFSAADLVPNSLKHDFLFLSAGALWGVTSPRRRGRAPTFSAERPP